MPVRLVPALFVLSGIAGLMLQVAWFRKLAQVLGGTLEASTVVLTAFMAGLAIGSWLFGRRASRFRSGVAVYGGLEIATGLLAWVTVPLLSALDSVHAVVAGRLPEQLVLALILKLVLAGTVLLPATILMGGTLPVLCQALAPRRQTAGTGAGGLYALNTLGAVLGSLLAVFVLLPRLGLSRTILLAGGIDVAVGLVVLTVPGMRSALAGALRRERSDGRPVPPAAVADLRPLEGLLVFVGLSGLAYEVLWTRVLVFYFGSGAHAFGLTLAVVLAGLAVGGFLGGALADRTGRPLVVLGASQVALAAAVVYQVWCFPRLPAFLEQTAARSEEPLTIEGVSVLLLLAAVQVLLPAATLMGFALPAAVRAGVRSDGDSGRVVGALTAADTAGTIPGAALAAWVLIPLFGTQGALFGLAGVNVAVGVLALGLGRPPRARGLAAAGGLLLLAGLGAHARWGVEPRSVFLGAAAFAEPVAGVGPAEPAGGSELVMLEESAHGTVSLSRVVDSRGTWKSLSIDGVNVAGTSPPLLSCQVLQGQLPLLLHGDPRLVLHVGFGSGGTAAAVASHEEVDEIHVVEINPAVLETSRRVFAEVNHGVLEDPRVVEHVDDGRSFLLASTRRFDVILSDSIHPRYSGNANLYTVEYFELCRERLRPGGLVSTWLPIYSLSVDSFRSIVASMRAVFPATSLWYLNSTVNEFVIVIGQLEPAPFDVPRMEAALRQPSVRRSLDRIGVRSLAGLLDFFVARGAELDPLVGAVRLHHDDLPWVEFESAAVLNRRASWLVNFRRVLSVRRSVIPHLRGATEDLLVPLRRYEQATTLQLEGQERLLSGDVPGFVAAVGRAVRANPEDREPWERFGAPAWVRGLVEPPAPGGEGER